MNAKILNIVFSIGAILVLISSVMVMEHVIWGKYCFAVGAAFYAIGRGKTVYAGKDFRIKRLNRLYFLSSILLILASYLQFKENGLWIVLLLVVAITEFYASVRLSMYEKANAEAEKKKFETDISSDKSVPE
jgi:hypothetical protein